MGRGAGPLEDPAARDWVLPDPVSVCHVRLDSRTVVPVRRHGNPLGPRLVLSHANGFAIDLYYPFWSLLEDDFDLVVYDLRNHGWNTVGARDQHNIPVMIRDHDILLESIARQYGEKPTIGVFHSVSALITLFSQDTRFAARVLFDPPVYKPGRDQAQFDAVAIRNAGITRRRAERFDRREDFVELLRYIPTFTRVVPGVRQLMARTTLRERDGGGGFELRCPREFEAQIMEYVRSFSPLADFSELSDPIKVIGADPTVPYSFLPAFDLGDLTTVDYDFIPDSTHLLQLEYPKECVAAMRPFVEQHGGV